MARMLQALVFSGATAFFLLICVAFPLPALVATLLFRDHLSQSEGFVIYFIANGAFALASAAFLFAWFDLLRLLRWEREHRLKLSALLSVCAHIGPLAFVYAKISWPDNSEWHGFLLVYLASLLTYIAALSLTINFNRDDYVNA